MTIFTAWVKIYSTEYFCNAKVAGLGKFFVQQKLSACMVLYFIHRRNFVVVRNLDSRFVLQHLKLKGCCIITYQ